MKAEFYYLDNECKDQEFRLEPPGYLHVDRLLQQKPYWQTTAIQGVQKQKTLIFADWRACQWENNTLQRIQKNISILLTKGFIIYAWQLGELKRLDNGSIEVLREESFRTKMTPVLADKLIALANNKLGLTANQIHILDDYWIDSLEESSDVTFLRQLRISELNKHSDSDKHAIIEVLKTANPPLSKMLHTVLDDSNDKTKELCLYEFPEIIVEDRYLSLTLMRSQLCNAESFLEYFNDADLKTIKNLFICPDEKPFGLLNVDCFSQLLQKMPRLNTLEIRHCLDINGLLSQVTLPYLDELLVYDSNFNLCETSLFQALLIRLQLTGCKIHDTSILSNIPIVEIFSCHFIPKESSHVLDINSSIEGLIISKTDCKNLSINGEKIKKIKIDNCPFFHGFDSPLVELESIYISGHKVIIPNDFNVLASGNKIKTIRLNSCEFQKDFDFLNYDLSGVMALSLEYCQLDYQQMTGFLSKTINLETLSLVASSLKGKASLSIAKLQHLKTIDATNSNINSFQLKGILSMAINVEFINLKSCRNLGSDALSDLSLPWLKKIDASSSYISWSNFNSLLLSSKKIESIYLNNCTNLLDGHLLDCDLPELRVIYLSGSSISRDHFFCIVSKSSKLKTISLNACLEFNTQSDEVKSLNFPELTSFNGFNTPISTNDLMSILGQSKKLTSLYLDAHRISDAINLSQLHFLYLKGTQFDTPEQFLSLLKASPNLEELIIVGACNWPDLQPVEPIFLPHLKSMKLSDSSLSVPAIMAMISSSEALSHLDINRKSALIVVENFFDQRLMIRHDDTITSAQLTYMINKIKNLDDLSVVHCNNMSDDLIEPLNLNALHYLLMVNTNLSKQIELILKAAPSIEFLSLRQNKQLPLVFKAPLSLPDLCEMHLSDCNIQPLSGLTFQEINRLECNSLSNIFAKVSLYMASLKGVDNEAFQPHVPTHELSHLDACTDLLPDKPISIKRIFFPLENSNVDYPVNQYRDTIYTSVSINQEPCGQDNVFKLSVQAINEEHLIKHIKSLKQSTDLWTLSQSIEQPERYQYARQDVYLTSKWRPVASITSRDVMTHYQISNQPDNFEIAYSEDTNKYYIRTSAKPHHATFDFIIQIPDAISTSLLDNIVKSALTYFQQFNAGALTIKEKNPTGQDYVNAMYEQKKGACRHRAALFMLMFQEKIPVRMITNSCHAYVEVKSGDVWIRCDLGGYLLYPEISDILKPLSSLQAVRSQPLLSSASHSDDHAMVMYWKHILTPSPLNSEMSLEAYYQDILANNHSKQLIELQSPDDVMGTRFRLQHDCQKENHLFFYVHKPEELVCSAPFLVYLVGGTGQLRQGPGGLFYDFLMKVLESRSSKAIILVNYDNFSPSDIVRFNSLLNKIRKSDGIILPDPINIIGLMNINKPNAYRGRDFYSRFDSVSKPPFSHQQWEYQSLAIPMILADDNQETIDLYYANDWKERLLGRWVIQKQALVFVEGALPKALKTGRPILLKNAPWGNLEFEYFWRQALLTKTITYAAGILNIPDSLVLGWAEGYPWSQLKTCLIEHTGDNTYDSLVLNPTMFSQFFTRYICHNEHQQLSTEKGWVEASAGQILSVVLTRSLSIDEWAMLLVHCQEHNVKLKCYCSPGTSLPEPLHDSLLIAMKTNACEVRRIILSSDVDTSLFMISDENAHQLIIDVSECSPSDLLGQLDAKLTDYLDFEFQQSKGFLDKALNNNQVVILKGRFSAELVDSLAALLLKKRDDLILISEQTDLFDFMSHYRQDITLVDKKNALKKRFFEENIERLEDELIHQESLSQLIARLSYWQENPEQSSDKAWQGMLSLPVNLSFPAFNDKAILQSVSDFITKRKRGVDKVLHLAPYVLLTGLTGVGKTRFVQDLSETETVYQGDGQIENWAMDSSLKQKILFIDEANLSHHNWSHFEGLFHTPPGILVKGNYYPLMSNHKVIFAGNPLSYGQGRSLPSLFARHGNALIFDPLPPEYIYQQIIKPIFDAFLLSSDDAIAMATILLNIYVFTISFSETEVLLSPRDVQMMALLTVSYRKAHPEVDGMLCAKYYAWYVARQSVNATIKNILDECFKPQALYPSFSVFQQQEQADFLITPSRYPLVNALNDLFALRLLRQDNQANASVAFGGLGGMIIEGSPGTGKSELVRHCLRGAFFYDIPVSLSLDEKHHLLLKAFDEGAIVVIDEINSSPMMEWMLNSLLMGRTPEGKRPSKPGFMIIGTQNSVTMPGRQKPSDALKRRLLSVVLPDYPLDEMTMILVKQGVSFEAAGHMTKGYAEHAKMGASQQVVFRDLIKLVSNRCIMDGYYECYASQLIEQLLCDKTRKELFNRAVDDPKSLNVIFAILPKKERLEIMAKAIVKGKNIIHLTKEWPLLQHRLLENMDNDFFLLKDHCNRPILCSFFDDPGMLRRLFTLMPKLCEQLVFQNLNTLYFMWHAFDHYESLKIIIDFLPNEAARSTFLAARKRHNSRFFFFDHDDIAYRDSIIGIKRGRLYDSDDTLLPEKRSKVSDDDFNNRNNEDAIVTYGL